MSESVLPMFFLGVLWYHVLCLLVLRGLVGLNRIVQLTFFSVTGWGIGLDCHDIEWFALEINRDHSVSFEIASKYCISDSCYL